VTHVDGDLLIPPTAQLPDLRGGKSRGRDANLRCGGDTKRRRQLRFLARQADGIERGGLTASESPEIG
jgi:hypothetical protein